ncbi:hypothetical protein KPL40_16835 [Clostridium gasigenes]|uniref:methionyl-tRNA formyltransferase n=1 Tax=Clostridium gasigenes TaxID=94869 RepID=UPI001C0C93E9|nr:formyltransferase family protein [Clostridium gasigenes]MBU3134095.1 hypothetical protein [Clostridium gasigenes]
MEKINFYLLNQKGYSVLKEFTKKYGAEYVGNVIIGVDVNIQNDYSNEIKEICIENNINYYYRNDIIPINNNYTFAIGWRWIIKQCEKLIVLHDSILPRYRGFAPLVNSIINGEEYLGVTALFASEEYDRGDIINQKTVKIEYPIKINDAIDKVSDLYEEIVIEVSKQIINKGEFHIEKQAESRATYSLWRDKDDYFINWNDSSERIKRFIDALGYPYDGAKCMIKNNEITIEDVTIINDVKIENRHIGKVIFFDNGKPVIVCAKGLIRIDVAKYSESQKSIFPLNKFRIRFE